MRIYEGKKKKEKKKRNPETGLPEERNCLRFGWLVELGASVYLRSTTLFRVLV